MTPLPLVLIRHGESAWNLENRFTGWVDVGLSPKGVHEAQAAGRLLKEEGFTFDKAYTSYLKRAIKTLWITLEELDQMWIPISNNWRLNERHYGQLQGLNKAETVQKYGEEKVFEWRRGYGVLPPLMDENDKNHPRFDPRYKLENPKDLPAGESLKVCLSRVLNLWESELVPALKRKERLVIVAHGNSLRALVKHIEGISDDDITELNIPTGIPYLYMLDETLKPVEKRYLGDPEAAKSAAQKVAQQTQKK